MSTNSILSVNDFQKEYKGKVIHFQKIDISKRVTIFVGENGSGKSTVLKAISKRISYQGTICAPEVMSYMSEHPTFPQDITVHDFLYYLSQNDEIEYDYNQLLIKYKLKQKENDCISTLSKGMKAKLNLIQCLMRKSDIYLLDEPLSGLDHESIKTLVEDIKRSKKYFVIASHQSEAFQSLESELIYIDKIT